VLGEVLICVFLAWVHRCPKVLPGLEDPQETLETLDRWFGGLPTDAEVEEYDRREAQQRDEEAKVSRMTQLPSSNLHLQDLRIPPIRAVADFIR
jgi:hypothetical protein